MTNDDHVESTKRQCGLYDYYIEIIVKQKKTVRIFHPHKLIIIG